METKGKNSWSRWGKKISVKVTERGGDTLKMEESPQGKIKGGKSAGKKGKEGASHSKRNKMSKKTVNTGN